MSPEGEGLPGGVGPCVARGNGIIGLVSPCEPLPSSQRPGGHGSHWAGGSSSCELAPLIIHSLASPPTCRPFLEQQVTKAAPQDIAVLDSQPPDPAQLLHPPHSPQGWL